jgi:hypothetical protein
MVRIDKYKDGNTGLRKHVLPALFPQGGNSVGLAATPRQ